MLTTVVLDIYTFVPLVLHKYSFLRMKIPLVFPRKIRPIFKNHPSFFNFSIFISVFAFAFISVFAFVFISVTSSSFHLVIPPLH